MQIGSIVIAQTDTESFVIKNLNNLKYIKIGGRELKFLLELNKISTVEYDLSKYEDLSTENKNLLQKKFEESGILDNDNNYHESKKHIDLSLIKLLRINPEKFYQRIYPISKFLFTKYTLLFIIIVQIAVTILFFSSTKSLVRVMFSFSYNVSEFIIFVIAMIITVSLHEIGHGTVCKKWGGNVSEMGIALFFIIPCMYCNVSDIYMLSEKKKKFYVAVSGLFVNYFLSTIVFLVYLILLNFGLSCNILLLYYFGNIGFIILNLLPFVKLDGYWVLSAITNISNLYLKGALLFLSAVFDFKLYREIMLKPVKKALLSVYGFIVIIFRPMFWLIGYAEINNYLDWIFGNYAKFVAAAILLIIVTDIISTVRKYFNAFVKQRSQILLNI